MTDPEIPLVRAVARWKTNGHLIADCVRLGYLRPEWETIDPTYGRGNWWTRWRPDQLTTHTRSKDGSDFRNLPYRDNVFDAAAYDPPYVCPGGRKTSTIKGMHKAYGMADPAFTTPAELQEIMNAGLTEMARIVRPAKARKGPAGIVLMKCKDYVWSGNLWIGTHHTLVHALSLGLDVVDRLTHMGEPGPQSQKQQVHARQNASTMFVFRVRP